jgi:hypothetical protein
MTQPIVIQKFGLTFPLPVQVIESDFPMREQERRYTCGHRIVKTQVKLVKGIDVPESTVVQMAFEAERDMKLAQATPSERLANGDGLKYFQLHFKGMRTIAQHYGMAGVIMVNASDELVTDMLEDGIKPAIEWYSPSSAKVHYSIITERHNGSFSIADPGCKEQLFYNIKRNIADLLWQNDNGQRRKLFAFWDREDPERHAYCREKYRDGRAF